MKKTLSLFALLLGVLVSTAQQNITLSTYSGQAETRASQSITLNPGFEVAAGSAYRAWISSWAGNCVALNTNPSPGQNYVASYTLRVPGITDASVIPSLSVCEVSQTIQYTDGLGRPLQTVQTKASPQLQDIVQPFAYDAFGRESTRLLPYTDAQNDGSYKGNALTPGQGQAAFYASPPSPMTAIGSPFSRTVMEASPLNRVLEQGAPGDPWQPYSASVSGSGHTVKLAYGTNAASSVRLWKASPVSGQEHQRTLSSPGWYGAGELYLTTSKDENWSSGKGGTTEEYKDKEGRVVLKRVWKDESVALSTQYVYDDLGNLSFVLPPGANPDGGSVDQTALDRFCYQYRYDGKGRVIEKRIPGKGWEHLNYTRADQVMFSQDSLQRTQSISGFTPGQYHTFYKYDGQGRVVMTGVERNRSWNRAQLQNYVDGLAPAWELRDNAGFYGYTNRSVPQNTNDFDVHTVNYYDDYDIPGLPAPYACAGACQNNTRGLLTATRTKVLGSSAYLWSVFYYDAEGRLTKTFKQHYLGGQAHEAAYDEVSTVYDFTGAPLSSLRKHYVNSGGYPSLALSASTSWEYDHAGRKINTREQIGPGAEVLLSSLEYNAVGQLKQKNLHDGLQGVSYLYNERGWLKEANNGLFLEHLNYNVPWHGAAPQYNGNIAEQEYQLPASGGQYFVYAYDKLNRLTSGVSSQSSFSEAATYDEMGNIASLNRDGTSGAYSYTGNRLNGVSGGWSTGTYAYDANGNATYDGRNGKTIAYNELNLPRTVTGGSTNTTYTYDAAGSKLRKQGANTTDYVDGIQYNNGSIEFIQTEEGIARNNGGSYTYEYFLKDHLGNTRVTFYRNPNNGQAEVLQQESYYPFGMRKVPPAQTSSSETKYLYNGKELQEELGQYDYGARQYDPVIGRWLVPDPLAEFAYNLTPFRYCFNNPVGFTDPYGLWETTANGYSTNKQEDIERFLSMMDMEKTVLKKDPDISQVSGFIDGEMAGGLGKLSDGSKLLSPLKATAYRQVGGGLKMYADKQSADNFWHQVQGDLTPDALDTRTLGQNLLGTSYAGGSNPKTYRGKDDYSYMPSNLIEYPAIIHDHSYDSKHVGGLSGLATSRATIGIDFRFVASEIALTNDPRLNALDRIKAGVLGVGLGVIAVPKTVYELISRIPTTNSSGPHVIK